MKRLASLLMMFALVVANAPALAAGLCRHHDAGAHAAARHSPDVRFAAQALAEESAAAAASNKANPADTAAASAPAFVLPSQAAPAALRLVEPIARRFEDALALPSRSLLPLLEPPSA